MVVWLQYDVPRLSNVFFQLFSVVQTMVPDIFFSQVAAASLGHFS